MVDENSSKRKVSFKLVKFLSNITSKNVLKMSVDEKLQNKISEKWLPTCWDRVKRIG